MNTNKQQSSLKAKYRAMEANPENVQKAIDLYKAINLIAETAQVEPKYLVTVIILFGKTEKAEYLEYQKLWTQFYSGSMEERAKMFGYEIERVDHVETGND